MTTQETTRPGVRRARFWRWAWLVVALVWPAFAHGCHAGDHDDELAVAPESRPVQGADVRKQDRPPRP